MNYLDLLNEETSKLNNLMEAKKSKIEKLSVNTAGSNPEGMNTLSAEELQYEVGAALTHNVMEDDKGNKFKWARTEDGDYLRNEKGEFIPEPVTEKTRTLYISNTDDGNYKLGLAASDVNPAFKSPITGESITPYEARYLDQTKYGNPYINDRKKLYNGTPGPSGVLPDSKHVTQVELPESIANKTEYLVHSNKGQIANRAMGQGPKTALTESQYGSGQTEYTTPNAPLWNINYDVDKAVVDPTTILPQEPGNMVSQKEIAAIYSDVMRNPRSTITEEISQLPGALAAGAVGGIMDLADFAVEFGQQGVNAIAGTKFKGGLFEDSTIENAEKTIGSMLGYSKLLDESQHTKIKEKFDSAVKDVDILDPSTYDKVDLKQVAEGLWLGLQDPTTAAYSIGMMAGTAGGGAKITRAVGGKLLTEGAKKSAQAANIARGKIAAVRASQTLSAADKAAEIARLQGTIKASDTAIKLGKDMSGPLAYGMAITNEDINKYRENNNGENPGFGRLLGMTLANTVAVAAPDIFLTKVSLGMNKTLNEKLKNTITDNLTRGAAAITLSGMGEIPQGTVQAIVQNINQKWETGSYEGKTMKDIVSDASADIIQQGLLEGVGGVHTATPKAVGTVMFSSPSEEQLAKELAKIKAKTVTTAKTNITDKFNANVSSATETTAPIYTPTQDDLDIEAGLGVNAVNSLFTKSASADELFSQLNADKIQLLNDVYEYDATADKITGIKDESKVALVEKWLDQYGAIQADAKGVIPEGIEKEIDYIKQANIDYAGTSTQPISEQATSTQLDPAMMERTASGSADMIHEKIGTDIENLSETDLIRNVESEIDNYVKSSGLDVALKEDIEELKSSIKTKILDKYNISGMVLPKGIGLELDKEALAAEVREKAGIKTGLQNRAMSKEGKVVETGSVTNQDLNDILTGEGTIYDTSHPNTKFRERIVRKLEPTEAGNVLSTLKDANEKLDKSIEKNLAEAGKYLKGDVVGNMKRLMAIAIDAINSQVASDTELRASVADPENLDSQLKENEYWAGTSNLLEQIAKNYATSHGIKLTAEDTKQLSKVYRPLSRFALQLLLDADLIEFTNDNMWSVAGATVGSDNKPLSTTNATGVKTKIVNNTLTGDKAVLVSDIGVRLKDNNIIDRSNPIVDEGNIQKYQSELGNAFKRVVSLMLPNNERLPSNEPIDKPIKHDDFIGVTKKTEEILQEHTNKPFKFKTTGYMLDILKYLKGLNETSGGLMKALSKKPEIKDFLLLIDNQAELLKVGNEGSIQGKLDNLIGILDNLDLLTNEDGIYETFQIDINNRLTIEQTVSNYQGDKVYARPMMGVGKYIISAKDFAAIEAHIAGLIDDLAGPNDKNQDPIDVLEKYTELFDKIVEAAKKDQGGTNFLENLMFRISTTPDLKHLKKKGGIRALSILQGAKDVIDSYSNDKTSKEEGKETKGYIETEYIPERDASASGVFNTTMNIIGRSPEFFTKRLKELGVVIDGEGDVNTTDAYSILKSIVDMLMESLETADPELGYSAATKDVESVQKLKNIINDDKFIRNLAKYPIMTWFYSAEEKSIVNNLVLEATKELVNKAVDGDTNVLNYLSTIMNKEITSENIKKIKVGSKEHKALRNELTKVGEVFYRNLNAAFPEVEQNKQEMKDYFEYLDKNSTFKGIDYWKGEIRTAISVMQGDPKTTSLYKWKNKIISMKAAEKVEAGLVTEEESNMLITERVRLSNETSMMAFFAHLVDSAQAIKWLESSDSSYAVQSKHDGFSGRPQDLLKSQKAVEKFTVELHQKYDFTNEMAIAMENTAARMEKDLDLYSGKDKADLTQKIRDLRAKADKIKAVNNPRMEAKAKVLANAKTYLFGTEGTDRDQYVGNKPKEVTSVEPVKTNEEVKQEQTKKVLSTIYDVIASLDTDDERKSSILENKEKVTIVSVTKDSRAALIKNFKGTEAARKAFKEWINSGNSFTSNGVVYIGDKTLSGKDEISNKKAEAEEILDVVSHEIEHAVIDDYVDKEYQGAIKREVEVVSAILKRAFDNKNLKGISSRAASRIAYIQKFVNNGNTLQAIKELVAISREDTIASEVFNAVNNMAKVKDNMLLGAIKSIWAKVQELLSKTPVETLLKSDNFDTYSLAVAIKSIQNKARSGGLEVKPATDFLKKDVSISLIDKVKTKALNMLKTKVIFDTETTFSKDPDKNIIHEISYKDENKATKTLYIKLPEKSTYYEGMDEESVVLGGYKTYDEAVKDREGKTVYATFDEAVKVLLKDIEGKDKSLLGYNNLGKSSDNTWIINNIKDGDLKSRMSDLLMETEQNDANLLLYNTFGVYGRQSDYARIIGVSSDKVHSSADDVNMLHSLLTKISKTESNSEVFSQLNDPLTQWFINKGKTTEDAKIFLKGILGRSMFKNYNKIDIFRQLESIDTTQNVKPKGSSIQEIVSNLLSDLKVNSDSMPNKNNTSGYSQEINFSEYTKNITIC